MSVPLLDLTRQFAQIRDPLLREIEDVIVAQQFILGGRVDAFEAAAATAIGCGHAIGMSSGTDAWLAILMALGIGPGDALVTTPYTFFATVGCIHRVGAETAFVDIDPATFNLDVSKLEEFLRDQCSRNSDGQLVTKKGNRVRAIVPVHLFGLCCDMDRILALAAEFGLGVIEDAAQAIGAEYPSAQGTVKAGAIADHAYFSFFPAKNLGAYGDAGMATCRTHEAATQLRLMRNHGMEQRYYHHSVGGNFRIDAIQAAILHIKLPFTDAWNAARRRNAESYTEKIAAAGLGEFLTLPVRPFAGQVESDHVFHQFVLRADRRDELIAHLAAAEIGHGVYYPVPLHLQECFSYLGGKVGDFPVSESASKETIALPIFPELLENEINEVVDALTKFYRT